MRGAIERFVNGIASRLASNGIVARVALALALGVVATGAQAAEQRIDVRLKELGRIEGWRENALIGYWLVTGLAGTGDSSRNRATRQSIANLMSQFGVVLPNDQIQSRNVAAVMVLATLPPFSRPGAKLDVTVNSMGDARSLLGGTLLLAPLKGVDGRVHALAQGPLSVGGYKYDAYGTVVQKNHPTVGAIPGGATVEVGVPVQDVGPNGRATYALNSPDYTTASRIADSINRAFGPNVARARDAASIEILVPEADAGRDNVAFLMRVENLVIEPDQRARVVINERTGMVIAGGDVRISQVTISHGELKISVTNDYAVTQPRAPILATGVAGIATGARASVVPLTNLDVDESDSRSISLSSSTTVADLVRALGSIHTSPREMISILQGIKAAGALYAELIIQ
jgi:flagellar P-ring protein precursor FlgI